MSLRKDGLMFGMEVKVTHLYYMGHENFKYPSINGKQVTIYWIIHWKRSLTYIPKVGHSIT
jgi:hypothetical protein